MNISIIHVYMHHHQSPFALVWENRRWEPQKKKCCSKGHKTISEEFGLSKQTGSSTPLSPTPQEIIPRIKQTTFWEITKEPHGNSWGSAGIFYTDYWVFIRSSGKQCTVVCLELYKAGSNYPPNRKLLLHLKKTKLKIPLRWARKPL